MRSTIHLQIQRLPDPYRSNAISNIANQMKLHDAGRGVATYKKMVNNQCDDIHDALERAFNWSDSNEGFSYWHLVDYDIKQGKIKLLDIQL